MKIYTGMGDRGKTSLFSGERVDKDNQRIDAFGDVDELDSAIGAIAAMLADSNPDIAEELQEIQSALLQIGALLATTPESPVLDFLDRVTDDQTRFLENAIDRYTAALPPLDGFILPGGSLAAAWSHVARTICRRAERRVVSLIKGYGPDAFERIKNTIVFLNRLSDYLFMLALYCNYLEGIPEIEWKKTGGLAARNLTPRSMSPRYSTAAGSRIKQSR